MKELVSLNGKQFEIWYTTPEQRQSAIKEAESIYSTASGFDSIQAMISCTTATKYVGQTVNLSSVPTSGTPPYTYSFYKMLPGTTTPIWLLGSATAGQSLSSYAYTLTSADITTISGQPKFGVKVFDSCATGIKTADEACFVNVVVACGTPVANLAVT